MLIFAEIIQSFVKTVLEYEVDKEKAPAVTNQN